MTSPLSYLGTPDASTTVKGKVELATTAECVAGTDNTKACTPLGVAAVAIAGAPAASTVQAGIIQIATNGEAAAQTANNLALVPSNVPSIMASPGEIGGSTPAAGTFTTLTATTLVFTNPIDVAEGGTGAATLTDHGIMLGSGTAAVSVTAVGSNNQLLIGQTGADPIWSNNIDVPGTLDVTGATTLDDTLDVAGAVTITAALTIDSLVVDDVTIDSNAIASSGSLDIDSVTALALNSSGGAINIGNDAVAQNMNIGTGAAARTITIGNVSGATAVAVNTGTGNFTVTTTGAGDIVLNSDDTVLIDADGVLELNSSAGVISIGNDADAQNINIGTGAAARTITIGNATGATGIDINTGSGGVLIGDASAGLVTVDTAAGISLDAATASNFTVTGAGADLTLASAGGSVLVSSTENAALAVRIHANGGTSETIQLHADQGTGVGSINLLSDVGGITFTATGLASADAINLEATAGGVDVDAALQINIASSQDAADAIRIVASAGGIDIDAVGASGQDIVITNTGGSASIVATEAAADAIVLNASDAAGGIDLLTGGGEITISSAGNVTMAPAVQSAAGTSLTINARVGVATFTGLTTAAGSTETLTITNSALGAGDGIFCTVSNRGTNDAQMTLTRVNTQTAGSLVVQCDNNGAAALNGDIVVTFWIIN
jgi:hypothetical protein